MSQERDAMISLIFQILKVVIDSLQSIYQKPAGLHVKSQGLLKGFLHD
jgi:hypothetical protein